MRLVEIKRSSEARSATDLSRSCLSLHLTPAQSPALGAQTSSEDERDVFIGMNHILCRSSVRVSEFMHSRV